MGKTLVIFDIDGTLVHSNKIDSQCFALTYQRIYGQEFPTIDWTQYPHVTDTTIFKTVIKQHFDRASDVEEMEEFQHEYVALLERKRQEKPAEFQEVPNARRTVERLLNDEGFVVGIGTGGWLRPAHVKLAHVGIPATSMVLAGADGHEQREGIIGQVVDTVAKAHEVSRTVYVGDAIWDVDTTRRMNMNFIGIRREGDFEVLRNAGTGIVLKDFNNYEIFLEAIYKSMPPKGM
ncbi:MAG: HAD hydrolase-like protein [Saprospiraceae bacterium]|nr:HAD hydrolase-like protein [Saprospiraceae bacterium]MCF8249196.1 HAD hydrolase-like protein [Saprospiraceae bacterium]MCF8280197.1 HAD hydrolase-like protein [Bacteroidales bacterium]MCF8311325.1 HAD hydrolase-like protein [Saprospiraceae bacterium]MCF8440111.1 HAD hydrolase-like protein [Saprospiraceae bacterium]